MSRILLLGFFLFGVLWHQPSRAAEKMNLQDCYNLALQRSETVAITEQEIAIAQALYTQALGSVLPKLSINVSELLQDSSSQSDGAGTVGSTFTQFSRPAVAVTLRQPIFRGFKEFRALKLAKVNESQKRLLTRNAERLLYQDVVIAFLTIVKIERSQWLDPRTELLRRQFLLQLRGAGLPEIFHESS